MVKMQLLGKKKTRNIYICAIQREAVAMPALQPHIKLNDMIDLLYGICECWYVDSFR